MLTSAGPEEAGSRDGCDSWEAGGERLQAMGGDPGAGHCVEPDLRLSKKENHVLLIISMGMLFTLIGSILHRIRGRLCKEPPIHVANCGGSCLLLTRLFNRWAVSRPGGNWRKRRNSYQRSRSLLDSPPFALRPAWSCSRTCSGRVHHAINVSLGAAEPSGWLYWDK